MTQNIRDVLKLALEWFEKDGEPDHHPVITAIKEALAQTELCKYGQEPKSCTSSSMDCQCAIDASLAQAQEPVCPDCKAEVLYECVACSSNNYPPQRTEQEPVACKTLSLEIKLPVGFMNAGVSVNNFFTADTNDSKNWDTIKFPLPKGNWVIKSVKENIVTLVNEAPLPMQPEQEPVAYDKTEMNCFVQDLYDKKMKEGKHGHYETMFHVVHQAIKRVPPQRSESSGKPSAWVGLTNNELQPIADEYRILFGGWVEDFARAIEAKLKEKNT